MNICVQVASNRERGKGEGGWGGGGGGGEGGGRTITFCDNCLCAAALRRNLLRQLLVVGCVIIELGHRLVGLVAKAFASRAEDPGFESRLRRDFSGSSHTSDLKIGTPVATLPGAWRHRVRAGTGRPGVSIL